MLIGKHAKHNWDIISDANPEWYWFHLTNIPSAHVILEHENPSKKYIYLAAIQCKKHSKYKTSPPISVTYCKVKFLEKGYSVGSVIGNKTKTKTIRV